MKTSKLLSFLTKFFTEGHKRSIEAKKQIVLSFGYKLISVSISYLLIPITINYLTPTKYGIWLTLLSIVSWVNFVNLGLGHGLRNKLAEAKASDNLLKAKKYVSTTYALMSGIIIIVYLLFLVVYKFINWSVIFNVPNTNSSELEKLIFVVFTTFSIQFVVRLIDVLFLADQKPSMVRLINTGNSLLALGGILYLTKNVESSLLAAGTVLSLSNIILPIILSVYFYNSSYKIFRPNIKSIDFSYAKDLFNLGIKFFILQLSAIIVFTTDNLIITQLLGPTEVTPYNIAFKYFSILTIAFTIITSPYWSAITEAYNKNEMDWIKNTTKKLLFIWGAFSILAIIMILFSNIFYSFWIGYQFTSGSVKIPLILNIGMCFWVIIAMFTMIFGNFVSGVSKINISLFLAVFVSIINIPLSIFLIKYFNLGVAGVIFATALGTIPQVIVQPIQYLKIINKTATGIWNK